MGLLIIEGDVTFYLLCEEISLLLLVLFVFAFKAYFYRKNGLSTDSFSAIEGVASSPLTCIYTES